MHSNNNFLNIISFLFFFCLSVLKTDHFFWSTLKISPLHKYRKGEAKTVHEKINRFVYICVEKCIGSLLFIITVTLFFPHIDPTFYSLNVECLCYDPFYLGNIFGMVTRNHTFVTSPEIFDFHCRATMTLQ
jgi:hypothetical protein